MAGMMESGLVEHVFRDRIGDERGRLAAAHIFDATLDGLDRADGVALVRRAGLADDGGPQRHTRQGAVEDFRRLARGTGFDRRIESDRAGCAHQVIGVRQHEKRMRVRVAMHPSHQGDLGPDTGRIALRDRQRRGR